MTDLSLCFSRGECSRLKQDPRHPIRPGIRSNSAHRQFPAARHNSDWRYCRSRASAAPGSGLCRGTNAGYRCSSGSTRPRTSGHATPTNSRKGDNESCLLFLCIRLRQLNKNKSLRHNTRVVFVSNPLRKACHYLRIYATIITTNERGNFNFSPNITEFFVAITVFFI